MGRLAAASMGWVLLAAGVAPLPARAQSPDPVRALSSLAPEIMFVRATGTWTTGEREGTSRIVLLRSGSPDGAQRLFVQWLNRPDAASGRPAIAATEEIPEVFDWRVGIEDYRVEPEANGARVVIDGRIIGTGRSRRYVLAIGPPGEVSFSALR
ncbi:hypothetical protein [Phreatobacter cathodiphilus]|uniref:DUF2844 domain-containing protein n=1 Tax=Phreatobacter cathodiphilus TaxID=1868589 RepID=A0A2S0NAQ6_9HYPH|nr:hypothetical protein [Phreatobacter cathodiphilus]AVO45176.1 hypothetical protein C6569_08935 [Phreatobacter cathodiphilus]